jgi:hypothetical protein
MIIAQFFNSIVNLERNSTFRNGKNFNYIKTLLLSIVCLLRIPECQKHSVPQTTLNWQQRDSRIVLYDVAVRLLPRYRQQNLSAFSNEVKIFRSGLHS